MPNFVKLIAGLSVLGSIVVHIYIYENVHERLHQQTFAVITPATVVICVLLIILAWMCDRIGFLSERVHVLEGRSSGIAGTTQEIKTKLDGIDKRIAPLPEAAD